MAEIRQRVRHIFQSKLALDEVTSADLEVGVFNWTINFANDNRIIKNYSNKHFITIYMNKARSVVANMDKESYVKNTRLLSRLQEHELSL